MTNAPEILLLQLKRFSYKQEFGALRPQRKSNQVKLNQHLKILRYDVSDLSQAPVEELTYKRVSAVIHKGSTLQFGHYKGITWEEAPVEEQNFVQSLLGRARRTGQTVVCHDDETVSCEVRSSPLAREIDTGAYLVAYHLVHRKDL